MEIYWKSMKDHDTERERRECVYGHIYTDSVVRRTSE